MTAKRKAGPLESTTASVAGSTKSKLSAASELVADAFEKLRKGREELAPFQTAVDALAKEHKEARESFERLRRARLEELIELHPDLVDVLIPEHDRYAKPTRLCREDCVRCRFEQDEWKWDGKPFRFSVSFEGWNE